MIHHIIAFSVKHKLIVLLFVIALAGWGIYSLTRISIGAVPDVTNNQVQVITTSRNLSTQDIEQFITYPVELEMANLPGVQEIRSISKFGLSVVTVVFDEEMGTYLPRQLIAEKLKSAAEQIPEGFGTPEMGPITTGLGEIYQYILEVEPGYESEYSIMDLRTIQDWIVKRQLSGIPGVVEVNTWGGYLKQYEVAVNPEKLKAMNVTVVEVFAALEGNNDVTGGGYIEKSQESYFIRGEGLVKSMDDIRKVVVKTDNGIPVYIRDIGTVQFGYATRFGAITGNGEGEKVMGQIMMLKDANSSEVISDVKERVAEVQKMLPKGVVINPFLERTELINKTTFTVAENLTLGALIVIFVLVLLLGNLRSGLIVASIIPLSLLFSISMMNVFGISANLMSLGAIDFGIIIDGAVIIIEYIVFRFAQQQATLKTLTGNALKAEKDKVTIESTTKMMQPAIFGQIIILIVFIPILSLSGIEGKMFRPMAMSFSFALLGAMILSLTYIPVMASLLSRPPRDKKSWPDRVSEKIMGFIQMLYNPIIHFALRKKLLVLVTAGALLGVSAFLFFRMGGEFIPTLDEGDYVVQPVLKTGTSLSQTIEIVTELEKILLDNFPEVDQVVTRIGAAEVPTDPMSMEETDVIIKLKPKGEWVSAETKDELADKMKAAMSVIPGLDFEFTQPIEMRFNELVTGVRADVAIKIYGEDLDVLYENAVNAERLVQNVEGAADISVEKVIGLPQITVRYNRDKIAQYGLKLRELNRIVRMAFAGVPTGVVFEGEKRFDLVVRFEENYRGDIEDMRNLYIDLPNGQQVPLQEVADIDYGTGPAKISRDDTKRRIVVGINVRSRDVESVVEEIQGILDQNLDLPPGYSITYGGQFENLQNAKRRLMVAVPIALALIFIMLYFTFRSLRQALLIYSAIPMAAVGGVLLLWFREIPFSISAGVGFIALFGIAVLNGIILIESFNELKEKGVQNIHQRVLRGTRMRLRPVLLTASTDALGFLPMALSTSAGAEVQRPLATVVIGGLVTATILTLVVLPILYTLFHQNETASQEADKAPVKTGKVTAMMLILLGIFVFSSSPLKAQEQVITLEETIQIALENNAGLQASKLQIERQEKLQKTAIDLGKTSLYYSYDENNIAENGRALDVWGVSQTIPFPTVLGAQHQVARKNVQLSEQLYLVNRTQVIREVAQAYYALLYQLNKLEQITYLDSLYSNFAHAANRRYEVGETDYLEKLNAEARYNELNTQKKQVMADVDISYEKLRQQLQTEGAFTIAFEKLPKLPSPQMEDTVYASHPGIMYYYTLQELHQAQHKAITNQWLPDFHIEYFYGYGQGENAQNYRGYQLGISIPLWFGPQRGRVQAQQLAKAVVNKEAENYRRTLTSRYAQLQSVLAKHNEAIRYYETKGLDMAREIVKVAQRSYHSGETGYLQYIQSLESASRIQLAYLENLNHFNQTVLELKYLTNL